MNIYTFIEYALLLIFIGCAPIGKVGEYAVAPVTASTGPDQPIGVYSLPGEKLITSPTSLQLDPATTQKDITITGKDTFVYKDIYLCKKPCTATADWTKIGEFGGTPIAAGYLRGSAGVTKQVALDRDILNNGNNFVAIFTCQSIGSCNNDKWLLQKFSVVFGECASDADCTTKKCDLTTKTCVAPSCTDGVLNGAGTDAETDVDCGGAKCVSEGKTCAVDKGCSTGSDCATNKCTSGKCVNVPDLLVPEITYDVPDQGSITIRIKIKNSGLADAASPIELQYTITDLETDTVKKTETRVLNYAVRTDETKEEIVTFSLGATAKLRTTATVDPATKIVESNEANNDLSKDKELLGTPPPIGS